jgi:hypothetical protein
MNKYTAIDKIMLPCPHIAAAERRDRSEREAGYSPFKAR